MVRGACAGRARQHLGDGELRHGGPPAERQVDCLRSVHRDGTVVHHRRRECGAQARDQHGGRRLRPERSQLVLRQGNSGVALFHRPPRRLSPGDGRHRDDQRAGRGTRGGHGRASRARDCRSSGTADRGACCRSATHGRRAGLQRVPGLHPRHERRRRSGSQAHRRPRGKSRRHGRAVGGRRDRGIRRRRGDRSHHVFQGTVRAQAW